MLAASIPLSNATIIYSCLELKLALLIHELHFTLLILDPDNISSMMIELFIYPITETAPEALYGLMLMDLIASVPILISFTGKFVYQISQTLTLPQLSPTIVVPFNQLLSKQVSLLYPFVKVVLPLTSQLFLQRISV